MKTMRNLALAASVLTLSGCNAYDSYNEVRALNKTEAIGSPYTQALSEEYRNFANVEFHSNFDYPDALHFARKGLAAASGENVMPEPLSDWNLNEEHAKELSSARSRLVIAYDLGARELAPALSARAQGSFDCWIEEQEENWESDADVIACKNRYTESIAKLETTLQEAKMPAPIIISEVQATPVDGILDPIEEIDMTPAEPMASEDAVYLVFLNWNSTELGASALSVLDAVAKEIKKHPPKGIQLIGHADTSGPSKYNQRLAFKRSVETREALSARGVDPSIISIEGRGEDELLVPTPDNVREPANRRVNISFQYDEQAEIAMNVITQKEENVPADNAPQNVTAQDINITIQEDIIPASDNIQYAPPEALMQEQ